MGFGETMGALCLLRLQEHDSNVAGLGDLWTGIEKKDIVPVSIRILGNAMATVDKIHRLSPAM